MNSLRISKIRARTVNVPLQFPVKTSVGIVATSPLVLIDMETNAGVTGRAYVFTYTPLALHATASMVQMLGDALRDVPFSPIEFDRILNQRLRLIGKTGIAQMASAGLDMAAWDILAKMRDLPLVELLGGARKEIQAYDSHSMDGIQLGVRRAAEALTNGYKAIKTKIGYASLAEDIAVVRSLKKVLGDSARLLVDYNQGLSVPEAIHRIRALEQEGISWVEEPTLQEDYEGHARIRAAVSLPVQMGENWFSPDEMAKALRSGACDLAMPDVMKIGGVTGWLKAAALAQVHGVPMSSHIFQEISVHLLAVTPTCHYLERMDLAGPILAKRLVFTNGSAIAPADPGIGIEWDEASVQKHVV